MQIEEEKKFSYKIVVIIYLSMVTTGIGYLTLPQYADQLGIFITLNIVLFAGLAQMISNFLLARLYNYHQITSYPGIVYEITHQQSQTTLTLRSFGAIFLTIFFSMIKSIRNTQFNNII